MSQKKVTGLSAVFEPSPGNGPAPSAVSSIASRFDTPSSPSVSQPKVSDKVSGIASRFGTTVADVATKSPPLKPKNSKVLPKEEEPPPVVAERPDFSAISARFASGRAGVKDEKLEDRPGTFARAASAFRKIEEENRPRGDGVVGRLKKEIETGARDVAKKEEKVVKEEKEERQMKMERVGSIKSKFEGGAKEDEKEEQSLVSRFENAAKVFGEEETRGMGGRVASASKVFGGDAK